MMLASRILPLCLDTLSLRIAFLAILAGLGMVSSTSARSSHRDLPWFEGSLDEALVRSRGQKKTKGVLVSFFTSPSDRCAQFETESLDHATSHRLMNHWVCMKLDIAGEEGARLIGKYHVTLIPTVLVLTESGDLDDAIIGYVPQNEFLEQLGRIDRGERTITALRSKIERDDDDLRTRLELAIKLSYIGDRANYLSLLDEIRERDPEGKTLTGGRLLLEDLQDRITSITPLTDEKLPPLYEFLNKTPHRRLKVMGYAWVADQEMELGRSGQARQAWLKGWTYLDFENNPDPNFPRTAPLEYGTRLVRQFFAQENDLSAQERRAVLRVAKKLSEPFRRYQKQEVLPTTSIEQVVNALSSWACAQSIAGQSQKAQEIIKRCLELDSENTELARLALDIEARSR